MTSEVQRRIDLLGDQLRRSVVLNDPEVRLVYASQHYGDEDPVRIRAALHRDAGSRPIAHLLSQGVNRWARPGRIPAAPELGLLSRLLVPVRWHGELLGSVVVIDADESLTATEIALIEDFAHEAAGMIVAERHAADQQALADEADVSAWLGADKDARDQGRAALVSRGLLPDFKHVRVLVVQPEADAGVGESRTNLGLRHAFSVVGSRLRGSALATASGGRGVLAIVSPASVGDDKAAELADALLREVHDFAGAGRAVQIGIGSEADSVADAWVSHHQAELAVRAVPVMGTGPVVNWNSLGVYQLLMRIPAQELEPAAIPAALVALADADPQGRLVETLEAYLRSGGAGSAAAAALHIHRTTLYYRLDRIREITGVNIDDGDARLLLHLGLATRRLVLARTRKH